ncbi:hypothetical protein RND71_009428 [Anisodus tanguticus]|uniref:ENTH domain-containing protein n=1 Tax=Anisodus tanguticus TaxID=243964 RepID=A0AAE1VH78_9SOLA|nr:hypothetical protein RND71_009428 [Anisodus tanguticus]
MSMSGGGTQNSLRKTLGALKDTTTVSLAKINSGYKELDIAIVKATNHVEHPAKEKYIRAIFSAISATRPRADVAYCIHALARRLSKTHNWAVALKTLIVIHRALREVDPTFHEELINYGRSRNRMLNMAHFKDDSSPNAWDYSAWVRAYALFLEERLECFRVLKYDVETDRPRTKDLDTPELLEQLPALQQLLYRIIGCQPQGASVHNFVVQFALSMVASESIKIYNAISDGTVNLVDKFFEMQRNDALRSLDIYRRAGQQESKVILAIEYKKDPEVKDVGSLSPPPPEPESKPEPVKKEAPPAEPADLLSLDDPSPAAAELDEKNSLALAIIPVGSTNPPTSTGSNLTNGTGWELALVEAPSSNESAATASKLAGGLDKLTLDSLYDDAMRQTNQNVSYNPWEQPAPTAAPMMHNVGYDPFYVSNMVAAPTNVQMAAMANQQQAFMFQQQQQQMMMMTTHQPQPNANPFANPYGANANPYGPGMPVQTAYNPYNTGLI